MVQDRSAIENSAFWLDRDTLLNFPEGVELATVPLTERDTLRKAFASLWINTFHSWPGNSRPLQIFSSSSYTSVNEIIAAFDKPNVFDPSSINAYGESKSDEAVLEIGVRRWLADQPDQAPRVLKVIGDWKWTSTHGEPSRPAELSTELLIVWSKADPTGLQKWADDPAHSDEKMVTVARSLLMDRVNEAVRQRWLDSMTEGSDDKVSERFDCLAGWHPQLGIDAAVRTANPYNVTTAIAGASRGPWWAWPVNTCHSGLGFMHQFDLNGLPEGLKQEVVGIWSNQLDFMESWGEVDIGEAARYGMHFLLTYKYASRTEVIQFLREGGDEGGMLDRTFCALRVWAVVRPTEMREWIKTQKGDDLQQALTWLLEHPWGTAETE